MKKPWVRTRVTAVAFAVLALAAVAPGALAAKGDSSAHETQTVTVTIPQRVGIKLSTNSISIDPTNQPGPKPEYPPDKFPAYYGTPSVPAVVVSVFANSKKGFYVTVEASGSPPGWLRFDHWYVGAGTDPGDPAPTRTPEGTEKPGSEWMPLGDEEGAPIKQTIIDKNEKTSGWDDYNVDLELKFNGDEESEPFPKVTLTYTIHAK